MLSNFQGYKRQNIIVVFDAHNGGMRMTPEELRSDLNVTHKQDYTLKKGSVSELESIASIINPDILENLRKYAATSTDGLFWVQGLT